MHGGGGSVLPGMKGPFKDSSMFTQLERITHAEEDSC